MAQPDMAGQAGLVVTFLQPDLIAEPEFHLTSSCYPTNNPCQVYQSYVVLQKMSSRGKTWDDCPELSFSRDGVTVLCFVNQSLLLPQSAQWLQVPWITSFEVSLKSERSAIHLPYFMYPFFLSFKKHWMLASCPAWGFGNQTVPALRKLPVV